MIHPDVGDLTCDKCGYTCRVEDLGSLVTITRSTPKPVPVWLAEYRAARAAASGAQVSAVVGGHARATVAEECPSCRAPTMEYYTMQLRSADEGQTVFFECRSCGHKFSVNT